MQETIEVLDAEPVTTSVDAYNPIAAALQEMRATAAKAAWDLETTNGDKAARQFRARCVKLRTSLTSAAKDLGEDLRAQLKQIGSERDRLIGLVREIEEPIDAAIKDLERRKEAEREAKRQAEANRVAALSERVTQIKNAPATLVGAEIDVMRAEVDRLRTLDIGPDFDEFQDRAEQVRAQAIAQIENMIAVAVEEQQRAAQLAAEKAEHERKVRAFEELQAKQAAEQAERDRLAAEAQAKIDAENESIAREKALIEEAKAAQARAEQEAKERAEQAERDRIEAEAAAERERLAAIEREKQEAAAAKAEKKRKAEEAKRAEELAKAQRMAAVGEKGYRLAQYVADSDASGLEPRAINLAREIIAAVEAKEVANA